MYYILKSIFVCLCSLSTLYLVGAINLNLWYSYPVLFSCLTILLINYHKYHKLNVEFKSINYLIISLIILSVLIYVFVMSKYNPNSNLNNLAIISGLTSLISYIIINKKINDKKEYKK